ncbi:MAG: prepilin-type N-terminal cleavage/methylation domain-containing protein [Verrucomicrobiota bacterium]|nr:prepilin-type N-terminal cleavage/methylation domain-containing protein [Verrucomicrobiota bacterium]
MKTKLQANGCRAFTLTEMMVTVAILLMVLAGVLTVHLFGIRMFQITKAKLGASDEARIAISRMMDEIRTGKLVKIGEGSLTNFTEVGINMAQRGSAVQIYSSTNTNTFIRYFWSASDQLLKRTTNGSTSVSIVASSITNSMVFAAEDHRGIVLTNNLNNRVISVTLQFFQIQYPIILIGPGQYYDFYQLRTKITRRALE